MAALTIGDVTGPATRYGFSCSLLKGKPYLAIYGGELLPLYRPGNRRVLDCFIKGESVYVSATRETGDDTPLESVLLSGIRADYRDLDSVLESLSARWDTLRTERWAETKERVGQERYRDGMMRIWDGRCALTGVDIPSLLVASHAVPWKDEGDKGRLDPYNGFLLESRFDKLFDQYLISFLDDGGILISESISKENREILGLSPGLRLRTVHDKNLPYLREHRKEFLKREGKGTPAFRES